MKDLREYVASLDREGELQRIKKEVDWDLELGAIMRRVYDLQAAAPLFEKIRGYPEGYRVLGAPLSVSQQRNRRHVRLALSLGMRADASASDIMEEYLRRKKNPIKPTMVSTGPCKENVYIGDEVDLEKLPIPCLHGLDGGRYLGTWDTVITKDPDTGWVNWGMYRSMLHDKKTLGILAHPVQHIGLMYYRKYEARNRPMEIAIAMGTPPVCPLVSAMPYPSGLDEVDIAGGLAGGPIELVKCETIDLAVPATSEIVIEGEVPPYERREEGPFGEYTGYMVAERAPRPVIRVKAISHRHDPILTVSSPGVPVEEDHALGPLLAAGVLEELREKDFPVKMVHIIPEAGNLLYVVSTEVPYPGYPKTLAHAIWGSPQGRFASFLIVLDDDVDVTNINEVVWALTTRCHPDRGIFKVPNTHGHPLLPFSDMYERRNNVSAQVLFDCTWPKDWPREAIPVKASFDVLWPKEMQEKVLRSWKEYGYRDGT